MLRESDKKLVGKSSRHCRLDKSRRDICRQASMCVRSIYTAYQEQIQRKAHSSHGKAYNHEQKSWNTFAFLGRFPIHTGPTPPLTPKTMFQLCIGWGEGELQENFENAALFKEGTEK